MKSLNEFLNESYSGPESINFKKELELGSDNVYVTYKYKGKVETISVQSKPLKSYPEWAIKNDKKMYKIINKNVKGVTFKESETSGIVSLFLKGEFDITFDDSLLHGSGKNNNLMLLSGLDDFNSDLVIRCSTDYLKYGDVTYHDDPAN